MNPLLFYEYGVAKKATGLPFISTWKTDNVSTGSSTASQVKLPLISSGSYAFNVDWGDGLTNYINSYDQVEVLHTYAASGTYTITITGTCKGLKFNNAGDKLKILNISQWGILKLGTNEGGYFYGCVNLDLSTVADVLNLAGTISLANCFAFCTSLTTVNKINEWNTSEVTIMGGMFNGASAFNQNINSWNTSAVTDMNSMFSLASAFNQPLNNWNTSAVTNMVNMFYAATAFNQDIGSWNTSAVIYMRMMFGAAKAFNQNIGFWNTSAVINMEAMFYQAILFNQDLGGWPLSKVTNMGFMFNYATAFNNGGASTINNWVTSSVTNMSFMFSGATAFDQNIGSWNTSAVTNMGNMFNYAQVFNNGGSSTINNWVTSSATNMSYMFSGAKVFNQNIGSWNTSAVTDMGSMFSQATAFNQNIGDWNISNVTSFSSFMSGKSSSTFSTSNLDAIFNGWSSRTVKPSISIIFESAKYTSASTAARAILAGAPNNWRITDGGITT